MTESRKLISVVTPCFNEEENVRAHFQRVCAAIEPFRDKYDFEHIYTDNCSDDDTFEILSAMAVENPSLRVMRFSRNIGGDRAIFFGLEQSRGDAVVLIQADLQDPPELISEFIQRWEAGADIAYGKIVNRDEGMALRACRRLYYRIISWLSDVPIPQNAGEFRLTSRRALDGLLQFREHDLYMRGAVAQVGFRQEAVPYERKRRAAGKSSVNIFYLFSYAINGLLSTTMVPIRAVTVAGGFFAVVGFIMTLTVIVVKFLSPDSAPHGFPSLACLLAFLSGVQMLSIGIIGEYLRKTYVQTLKRPMGFIQDRINFD